MGWVSSHRSREGLGTLFGSCGLYVQLRALGSSRLHGVEAHGLSFLGSMVRVEEGQESVLGEWQLLKRSNLPNGSVTKDSGMGSWKGPVPHGQGQNCPAPIF